MDKKTEFSKISLALSFIISVSLTVYSGWLVMNGHDISSFANIVLAFIGELSAAHVFYLWKAKAENKLKIAGNMPKEVLEKIEVLKGFID